MGGCPEGPVRTLCLGTLRRTTSFSYELEHLVARQPEIETGDIERRPFRCLGTQHEHLSVPTPNSDGSVATRALEQGGEVLSCFRIGEFLHGGGSSRSTPIA